MNVHIALGSYRDHVFGDLSVIAGPCRCQQLSVGVHKDYALVPVYIAGNGL